MWHEARKQERKIRGMLVDYRKRAERRQDFYERIRADPTQFIQIHGRKCKIHLDPSVAAAGDSPAIMMPWQGHQDIMIDRFDGRAHLDYIAQMAKTDEPEELTQEERQGNYERYRILAQNDFLGISEDKYLHQLYLEEQFGVNAQIEAEKAASKKKSGGVTIGYVYEETDPAPPTFSDTLQTVSSASGERGGESSDSELDMDVSIDVSKLDTAQAHEINEYGRNYGMKSNDFYSFLTKDADEADALRLAKEEEQEKIMFSGRKSRRERRAQRDKKLTRRPFSPPSYAAPEEKSALKEGSDKNNSDESRSPSPVNSGKITYITSFGGEDELQPHSKISINFNKNLKGGETLSKVEHSSTLGSLLETGRPMTYAEKVKQNLDKLKVMNNMPPAKPPATGQVEYVGKPVRYLRTNSVHRSRSRSRGRNRRYSRSRSRSKRRRWSSRRSRSSSRSSDRRNRSSRRGRRSRRSSSSSSSPSPRRKRRYSSSSSSSSTSSSSESPKRARSTSSSSSTSSTSPERRKSLPVVPVVRKLPSKSPAPAVPAPAPPEEKEKIVVKAEVTVQPPPEVPVKRYYGRKREDRSSSSSSDTELTDGGESKSGNDSSSTSRAATNSSNTIVGKTTASETKVSSCLSMKVNPRDRLKRKMQILLNKQFKADKKAEIERTERQMQQQQERDDEMRELALRLRRRQRELRHKYGTPSSSRSRSPSQSPARLDEEELYRPREKARSRSRRRSEDRVRHRRDRSRERSRDRRRSRNRSRGRSRDSRSRYRRSRSDSRGRKARRSRSRSRSRRSRRSDSRDRSHSQKSIKKLVDY